MNKLFTDRINYKGDLHLLLQDVSSKFKLGEVVSFSIIEIGYEDLNVKLETSNGSYLVKIFGSFRDELNCRRYVEIMKKVVDSGIAHPRLFSSEGEYLYKFDDETSLCVMEFINGNSYYDMNQRPTLEEAKTLIGEASKINSIKIDVDDYYDEWSPVNFIEEFKMKKQYLDREDRELMEKLVVPFSGIDKDLLTSVFVHGDIIRPNVLKDTNSKIYIVDYSCSSIKPRVQELAILFCGMFFNEEKPAEYDEFYKLIVDEYKPGLSEMEKQTLPLFIRAGFSMYVLQGIYTRKVKGISHKENDYWIRLGQIGLRNFN